MLDVGKWYFFTVDGTYSYFFSFNDDRNGSVGKGITFPKWDKKPIYQWDARTYQEDEEDQYNMIEAPHREEELSRKVISFVFENTAYVLKVWDPFDEY
jgi:hypothetical protein